MGNSAEYWDAVMEDWPEGSEHPLTRVLVALRGGRDTTITAIAAAAGVQPGTVGLYVLQARRGGHRIITGWQAGETTYRLEKPDG
jgi:hypothetical protein